MRRDSRYVKGALLLVPFILGGLSRCTLGLPDPRFPTRARVHIVVNIHPSKAAILYPTNPSYLIFSLFPYHRARTRRETYRWRQ
jgi:hypothetical protein